MMRCPRYLEIYRREYRGSLGDASNGCLVMPARGLVVIFSNGLGWEHVSVSHRDRTPTWDEMDRIKREFWAPKDTVMQLHVPPVDHINLSPHCLHLWRPIESAIPRPPAIMVA